MLSLARRSGGIFELVLNIPNVIAVSLSIADPSRADHTNRAARGGNECLSRSCVSTQLRCAETGGASAVST